MKNTNFSPQIAPRAIYRPGDFEGAWTAMKIAAGLALGLFALWIIVSASFKA